MFKKVLIVLSIFFLLGMATKAEVEGVKEEVEKEVVESETNPDMWTYETLIKPEEEPALYKTSLSVETSNEGIATGHFIAYGHYIKQPYKFEIREDTLLFLNGIRIHPRLISKIIREEARRLDEKYEEASKIAEPHSDRLQALYDDARELYKKIAPKKGREAAVDAIRKSLKKDSLIVDVTGGPQGKEDYLLNIKHYIPGYNMPPESPGTELVELIMYPHKLTPTISKEERFKNLKESAEKELIKGDVIIISSTSRVYCFEMTLKKILKVLRSDLSDDEKYEKLYHTVGGDVKEMLYNFDPDEWPEINEEGNLR